LRAAAGEHDEEVDLLVAAAELGIARELIHERDTGVRPGRFDELAAQLVTRREVSESDARWAVDTWAWRSQWRSAGWCSPRPRTVRRLAGRSARVNTPSP
jgi:hypothetical protein